MGSSLVYGKYVVCKAHDDDGATVISNGAVFQRDGTIIEVGEYRNLLEKYHPTTLLGSFEHVVFPGLVNSHHHVGLTPFQMGSPDLPLELWTVHRFTKRDVDPHLDTLYSAFEMVECGVTAVQHLHSRAGGGLGKLYESAKKVISAYKAIGMRVSYSFGVRDQNRFAHEADELFVKRLPEALARNARQLLDAQHVPLADTLQLFEQLYREYADDPFVKIQLAPINLHWCSDKALESVRDFAEKYSVLVHMHLLETCFQNEYGKRRSQAGTVQHLRNLGLLGPHLTLGHCVWASDDDLDTIAETGTRICHNASSNLRLRSGVAPLRAMQKRGIQVAIGIDEAGINDDRDMLQEMRVVLRLHRAPGLDENVPTPCDVFRMATQHGALTTGFGRTIGTLEPGCAADMTLMKWDSMAFPYLDPNTSVVDALVYRGKREGVDLVLVGGSIIYEAGEFTKVNKRDVLAQLAQSLSTPLQPQERWRHEVSNELIPFVRKFYEENYLHGS